MNKNISLITIICLWMLISSCTPIKISSTKEVKKEDPEKTILLNSVNNKDNHSVVEPPKIVNKEKVTLFTRLNELPLAAWLDLDNGAEGLGQKESADLVFTCSKGSAIFYTLSPVNGAIAYHVASEDAGFNECMKNIDSFSEGNNPDFVEGIICILTSEGRMGKVQYVKDSWHSGFGGEASILILITVWDNK
jgi:hypothetical protein